MLIQATYACSMGCSHCMSDCKPDGQHMSVKTFSDALDFMNNHEIFVWPFSGGEMFENPDILQMLEVIEDKWNEHKNNVHQIIFITNGRKLVRDPEIYNAVFNMYKRHRKQILIQVTDDPRFYPDKLTDKEKYWLRKMDVIVEEVPGDNLDKNKCLYPQGRALDNYDESNWNTVGPKCANARLLVKQRINNIHDLYVYLLNSGKICTPVIAPDGSIKVGESALCPSVATIYDSDKEIIDKINKFKCMQCKIPWSIMEEKNSLAYHILTEE